MKKIAAVFLLYTLFFASFAQISFSNIDINAQDTVLFTTSYTNAAQKKFAALFSVQTPKSVPSILTCSPQKMEVLNSGKTLQLRNWYGTAQYSQENASLNWILQTPLFTEGTVITSFEPEPVSVSPNGMWTVTFRKTDAAYGALVLSDIANSKNVTIASNLPLKTNSVPVSWSPDSSLLIYEKPEGLYFAKPSQFFTLNVLPEKYRKLGEGTISSAFWANAQNLIYINDANIFSVSVLELQIRALYANFAGIGKFMGTIPCKFNSRSDSFWANADGTSVVIIQNNRTVLFLTLNGKDFTPVSQVRTHPFASFKDNVVSTYIFWNSNSFPILWIESILDGKTVHNAFRFSANELIPLALPENPQNPLLSPDKSKLAVNSANGLYIYDISLWQPVAVFAQESVQNFVWSNSSIIYIAGEETLRYWNITQKNAPVLFLTNAKKYGWNANEEKVIAFAAKEFYEYNPKTRVWTQTSEQMRNAQIQNAKNRIFLENTLSSVFTNTLFIRSLLGVSSNIDIFAQIRKKIPAIKPKKNKAFAFDALNNADGLSAILATLQKYNIKATFFINGEFIRRFPHAVKEIVQAGHQCGSLFYADYDFSDPQFITDNDFILKGLARTEEEFFAVTGQDLSPIWHTPNYIVNSSIRQAGISAGYTYIDRSIGILDWVSIEQGIKMPGMYIPSEQIIASLAKSLDKITVLPLTVGLSQGVRFDYVYDNLEILIQAILSAGYTIGPVSELK